MKLPPPKKYERERGSVAAELVILLPVFLLLFFAILEFGNFMAIKNNLTSAAREGARIGVLPGAAASDVRDRIISALAEWKISFDAVDVYIGSDDFKADDAPYEAIGAGQILQITIVMAYENFGLVPQFFASFFPDAVGTVIMRKETINAGA
ncbi:MAG: pilus assembly protein [Candidatus Omnitrophica bacterium]|nr:pilus assembly protein [Candidatus Omnitrophota bacterium]